jgi:hypothetical protein
MAYFFLHVFGNGILECRLHQVIHPGKEPGTTSGDA